MRNKCECENIHFDEVVYFPKEDRFYCETCEKPIQYHKFGKLQEVYNN